MRARNHIIVSAGVSMGFQAVVHSWPATLGCFFSGFLIDLDHYAEFYIIKKRFPFRYKDLVDFCLYNKDRKLYLILHGYEYLFLLWGLVYLMPSNKVLLGVTIGLTVHIILDQFTNPIKPLFYFLTYRIKNQFEKSKILSEDYFKRNSSGMG